MADANSLSENPRRQALRRASGLLAAAALPPAFSAARAPLQIGIDAEFGLLRSTSAQAIQLGAQVAVNEINAAGGLLGGRPLELVLRDNHSVPARGVENLRQLAALPGLVAVIGGRFSPVVLEQLPLIAEQRIPFIASWSSAEKIVKNEMRPNYVFRVSLSDSIAMPFMLDYAKKRRFARVGLMLSNTAWGRSNLDAAERYLRNDRSLSVVTSSWINWADTSLISKYRGMVAAGAQAIVVVANDEIAVLVREMATLPPQQRLPLILHWGVTGGEFAEAAGAALRAVDVSVLQTFSFFKADPERCARFLRIAEPLGVKRIEDIRSAVGVAHAYDAVHLLALAITKAGSADRVHIRNALERLPPWQGLVKYYRPAFAPDNHEALSSKELLMARYRDDGVLVPR
jgi:branched-chain amino acid transport system substrate-binding protein